MADVRAIVFDLDDTLYPYRAFVGSGFRAVADAVSRTHDVTRETALRVLRAARGDGHRGRELQRLCEVCALPMSSVAWLRQVLLEHTPSLRLPQSSRTVLQALGADWRIGVLTNGSPAVQARKVLALGLEPLVDAVVFASEHGDGAGKPAPDGFEAVLRRLRAEAQTSVFVGNDPVADMRGAAGVGFNTIHVCRCHLGSHEPVRCDASVTSLLEVPALAAQLVGLREPAYVV